MTRTFLFVSVERLDVNAATTFVLDEAGLMRCADDLERLLPAP